MAAIDQHHLDKSWRAHTVWPAVAQAALQWLSGQSRLSELPGYAPAGVTRDAVVLVPFAALLAPLRAAFAAAGGWQPRVETPLTLAAVLAPPLAATSANSTLCTGDAVVDALRASAVLQAQAWGRAWAQRDAAGFQHAVDLVVDAALALRSAAATHPPAHRPAFWDQARALAAPVAGPAGAEASLLQLALEWAAASCQTLPTDVLFTAQPAAWVLVRIGGADAVAEALVAHAAVPALRVWLDPADVLPDVLRDVLPDASPEPGVAQAPAQPGAALYGAHIERLVCDDFEAEAQASTAAVIDALNAGHTPVALVAQDRALVRRVRALLERAQVPVLDETGWLLSTTRAGAVLMALLKAAQPGASRDEWLDWLKAWPGAAQRFAADSTAANNKATDGNAPDGNVPDVQDALEALESAWRQARYVPHRAAGLRLWQLAKDHLRPLLAAAGAAPGSGNPPSLFAWLGLLHSCLVADNTGAALQQDAAGAQVWAALRLSAFDAANPAADPAWAQTAAAVPLSAAGFVDWVSATLEAAPYLPLPDHAAQVVLTPLARAYGRRFGQVVLPGADDQHLGAPASRAALISNSMALALNLPSANTRRWQQRLALLHTLRAPRVLLLRRHADGAEPLTASPDVAWLLQSPHVEPGAHTSSASTSSWPTAEQAWLPTVRRVPQQPVQRPLPVASSALPAVLSASQLEYLRDCPYRFFARAVLRLQTTDELDADIDKRHFGNWLHAVLHRFHEQRDYAAPAAPQLHSAAAWVSQEQDLSDAQLLPFKASFDHFVPRYLAWQTQREAQGWYWADGESDHSLQHPTVPGLQLKGRIDRLDHGPDGERQLLDYKTSDSKKLKDRVKEPLEDTQLVYYTLLLSGGQAEPDLLAAYLSLDSADAPLEVVHTDPATTATALLLAVGGEWQRMRQGAALPALGEGTVCKTCEARGLCRRDEWVAV